MSLGTAYRVQLHVARCCVPTPGCLCEFRRKISNWCSFYRHCVHRIPWLVERLGGVMPDVTQTGEVLADVMRVWEPPYRVRPTLPRQISYASLVKIPELPAIPIALVFHLIRHAHIAATDLRKSHQTVLPGATGHGVLLQTFFSHVLKNLYNVM